MIKFQSKGDLDVGRMSAASSARRAMSTLDYADRHGAGLNIRPRDSTWPTDKSAGTAITYSATKPSVAVDLAAGHG